MKKILIVEDDNDMCEILSYTLKNNSFKTNVAKSIEEMWKLLGNENFDLILLDVGLPDGSGMDAISALKSKFQNTGIIMVTARRNDMDKIIGLELGADDYVTKPFNNYELLARIKAVLRRNGNLRKNNIFKFQNTIIHLDSYTAIKENGEEIQFTNKEFKLLKLFIKYPQEVFSREELLDIIWGEDFEGDFRTVDVHISKIRKKLGENIIKTIIGVGYKLGENVSEK